MRKRRWWDSNPQLPTEMQSNRQSEHVSKRTNEVGESEDYGALPLRRDELLHGEFRCIASCADGTRTHNPRLLKHVLQFGSRSYFQGDEAVVRGSVRESNPPTTWWSPVALGGRCTPTGSRHCVFNSPTKDCRELSIATRPSVSTKLNRLIVDWPLRLGETPAPFTSWSPSVATLGRMARSSSASPWLGMR